ncbi:hypothetical protein ZOSMA_6G00510 [Zostera marina]|uniref:DEK-C domain-containing protein n=1 Tax=Zostera marina TaxID=29655 RepID=A0A0K9NSW0_ZOSMR|nr:hypothetical protein ZOSMA_6G00510 [Zostera marina]
MSEKDPKLTDEISKSEIGAEKPKTLEIEALAAKNDQEKNDTVIIENKCEDSSNNKKAEDVNEKKNVVVEDNELETKEAALDKMDICNNFKDDQKNENEEQKEGAVQDVSSLVEIEHTEKDQKVNEMSDAKKNAAVNKTERIDNKPVVVRQMENIEVKNIVDGLEESELKETVGKINEIKEVLVEKEKCEEDKPPMKEKDEENKENEDHKSTGEDTAMEENNDPEDEENKEDNGREGRGVGNAMEKSNDLEHEKKKTEGEDEVVKEMDEKAIEDDKEINENGEENVRKRKRSGGRGVKKGTSNESKEIKGKEDVATPAFKFERPQRERKTVERLVEVIEKGGSAKRLRIEKGNGTPLKDIPNVAYKLSEKKPDDIKSLHLILFGRKGKAIDFKNHISEFSGFVWHGDEDKQRLKVKEKLDKCIKEKLCDFCDVFDIRVSRTNTRKEDLVTKLLDFLVAPRATTDVLLEEKYQSPSMSGKRKRGARGSGPRFGGSSGKPSKKRWAKGDDDTSKPTKKNASESESESEDEEHVRPTNDNHHSDANNSDSEKGDLLAKDVDTVDEEESEKSSGESKKFGRKKGMIGCTNTRKENTPLTPVKVRSSTTPKIPAKTSLKKTNSEKINNSSEKVFSRKKKVDEVPMKRSTSKVESKASNSGRRLRRGSGKTTKTKGFPNKEELRRTICEILKDVDFNTATFTDILKRLAEHFKTDLSQKKPMIKLMIQEELTKLAEAEEDEDDSGNDSDVKPSSPSEKVRA